MCPVLLSLSALAGYGTVFAFSSPNLILAADDLHRGGGEAGEGDDEPSFPFV